MPHCTSEETTGCTRLVTLKMDALAAPYGCNDVIFDVTACKKDVTIQRKFPKKFRWWYTWVFYLMKMIVIDVCIASNKG